LGAGLILQRLSSELKGKVQLVFQPGEEKLPGGAKLMLEAGIFQDRQPDAIFALHVFPQMQVGHLGFRSGMYMASTDELYFTVRGKGGHAAMPHQVKDPILAASAFVVALQQVTSRLAPPTFPTVLSVGKINSIGGATNVIPDEVKLEGTFRTFSESWRTLAHEKIISLSKGLVEGMGGTIDFRIEKGYPVVYNNPELTERSISQAKEYLGEENVIDLDMRTTAEDFAYYSQVMPGCFYRLGTSNEDGTMTAPVHNSKFAINENALKTGMGLLAWHAIQELK
jgi:amidohydrolase